MARHAVTELKKITYCPHFILLCLAGTCVKNVSNPASAQQLQTALQLQESESHVNCVGP